MIGIFSRKSFVKFFWIELLRDCLIIHWTHEHKPGFNLLKKCKYSCLNHVLNILCSCLKSNNLPCATKQKSIKIADDYLIFKNSVPIFLFCPIQKYFVKAITHYLLHYQQEIPRNPDWSTFSTQYPSLLTSFLLIMWD